MSKLLALMALLAGASLHASPDMTIYDFGKVAEGATVVHEFEVTNTETTKWAITSAETSCDCVSVDGWQGTTQPGEIKKLKVSFDTSHAGIGPLVRVAFLSLAGHPQPKLLVLRGEIWPAMDCKPQVVLLTNTASGPAQGQIALTNHFDTPVTLQSVATERTNICLLIQTNTPGYSYSIRISAADPPKKGDAAMIRIMTSVSTNTIRVYIPGKSK